MKRSKDFNGLPRLLGPYLRKYKAHLFLALLAIGLAAAMILLFGWELKNLIDRGFSDTTGAYLDQALLILLGVVVALAAASYTRFYTVWWIAEQITVDLRKRLFGTLLSLDPAYFEVSKTGDEVSRINADTTVLQMVLATNAPTAVRHLLTLLGGISMLFVVSAPMTMMVMVTVPIIIGPIVFFARRVRSRSRETQNSVGDIGAFSHEALQGIQTIQSFGYESHVASGFGRLADVTFAAALRYIKMRSFLTAFAISAIFGAIGVVLWAGGHRVLNGEMTAGSLSAFVFYAIMVSGAVAALGEAVSAFAQASGAADRIVSLLSETSHLKGEQRLARGIVGDVRFDRVTFTYPTRLGHHALNDVSFTVKAGQVVALVGASGAGKSTVFQLLQRFYDPESGIVFIDDLNTADFTPHDIRRCMTVVSQDPAVFSFSIAENIRIGKPDATDEEVRSAAALAQAHDFISRLPQGYETPVGEHGSRLSGGQKQRIAIARAILKDARILLLDEATSALDSSNELAVHTALKNLMQGRTTLIIAHRLSTVQNADHIIVLDQGHVVAEGTHDALYGKDRYYTHLAGLQLEGDQ